MQSDFQRPTTGVYDGRPLVEIALSNGSFFRMWIRRRVSRAEFDKIKAILELAYDGFVEDLDQTESRATVVEAAAPLSAIASLRAEKG